MKPRLHSVVGRGRRGLTLIELIGVLAIAAIIATFAVNSSFTRLKQGYRDQEAATLNTLANGLTDAARLTRYIPAATNWASTLAAQLVLAEVQVSQNRANNARSFLVDPAINVTLPYIQTGTGMSSFTTAGGSAVAPPANLRFLFLSSVGTPLPALTGITFDTIWNTAPKALPAGWPSSWKGEVADVLIQRVDLRGMLVCLVLNNLDATNTATWTIDGASGPLTLPAVSQKIAWYFNGSFLSLYDKTGTLFNRAVLNSDASNTYQFQQWGLHLTTNGQGPTADIGEVIDTFLATPAVPLDSSRFGANQQVVVDEMFIYMRAYGLWGAAGFPTGGSTSSQQVPEWRQVNESQARLDTFSYNLVK